MFEQLRAKALVTKGGSHRIVETYRLWRSEGLGYTGDVYVRHGTGYAKVTGYGDTSIKGLKVLVWYNAMEITFSSRSNKPSVPD